MDARIIDLPFDPGTLSGLSQTLLRSHYQKRCGGALRRLNEIRVARLRAVRRAGVYEGAGGVLLAPQARGLEGRRAATRKQAGAVS